MCSAIPVWALGSGCTPSSVKMGVILKEFDSQDNICKLIHCKGNPEAAHFSNEEGGSCRPQYILKKIMVELDLWDNPHSGYINKENINMKFYLLMAIR